MQKSIVVPLRQVVANPYQPRLQFNTESIQELANSIKENGLIQPISVREHLGKYEIVAGERRFRALQLLGLEEVSVHVLAADELQMAEFALVENIQRENLSAIEEAKAYVQIMKVSQLTQSELAKKMGKTQGAIANKIRLLQLDEGIQEAVSKRELSERHARALLSVPQEEQFELVQKIKEKGLTVAQTEALIKKKKVKENKEEQKTGKVFGYTKNIKIAYNTIVEAVKMVQRVGVACTMEEDNTQEEYQIIIKIPR